MDQQQILFTSFVVIFLINAAVAILGITNVINIKEGYLKPLFTALILEVIGGVVFLFKVQNFDEFKFPDELYNEAQVARSESQQTDIINFLDVIKEGNSCADNLEAQEFQVDSLLNLTTEQAKKIDDLAQNNENFYRIIVDLESLRSRRGGSINLNSKKLSQDFWNKFERVLVAIGYLNNEDHTRKEIRTAYSTFKKDNGRSNSVDRIYLQDIPLMVKDYLVENYELPFSVANPNIPASLLTGD
ncbi:hypothetical protein [Roseivirga misakiensis]|uniref:Uncharacterized protein n=1 Tax=Roseivirga misakiensis TaxID=1563681 RepID=A0A1E5T137_9BACT|nr:hypothetical protein [Roseivirga misakiensis]OEK05076.1 hypothetical protein BFP71_16795 [Roseivirga misakiensis]